MSKEDLMAIGQVVEVIVEKQLEKHLEPIRTDIRQLKTDVTELKADVAVLKTDVTELKADVAVLKTDVTELKADMTIVKSDVGLLAALSQLDEIKKNARLRQMYEPAPEKGKTA